MVISPSFIQVFLTLWVPSRQLVSFCFHEAIRKTAPLLRHAYIIFSARDPSLHLTSMEVHLANFDTGLHG